MGSTGASAILLAITACLSDPGIRPCNRFEVLVASHPTRFADGRIEVGWIEASRLDDPTQVQKIPLMMNRGGNWAFEGLTMEDITCDGYLDIATIAASVAEPAIRPPHRFELIVAEEPIELADMRCQVGWIKASLPDDASHVQRIPVVMNETEYWTFQKL